MKPESKIVDVIKRICENARAITDIYGSGPEYYFKYKDYTFSVLIGDSALSSFFIYPKWRASTKSLADEFDNGNVDGLKYLTFRAETMGPQGAENLGKLYEILELKDGGLEQMFDDILDNPEIE